MILRKASLMDNLTPKARSAAMAKVKGEGTGPEVVVRRVLARLGFRFTANCRDLPGCPDIVLRRRRIAIMIHGCFWHVHTCRSGRKVPVTNAAYWRAKRKRNQYRDQRVIRQLRRDRWRVLVVWECQLRDPARLGDRLRSFLVGDGTCRNGNVGNKRLQKMRRSVKREET
jgi:DNA mismatch endonuclease (patch repair protein)